MRQKKKNKLALVLIVLIATLGLGYAFLQTDLTINGTGKIAGNNWNIYFDNIQVSSGSATLQTGDSAPTINPTTLTDVTYTITLLKPGDFYEFTVDVVNDGTLNAMIGTITNKLNGVEISSTNPLPNYLNYSVTYEDDVPIAVNHLLEAGHTETYKVRVEFKMDINSNDLPATLTTNTLSFGVSYVQEDNNAIAVPHPFTGTKYTINSSWNGDRIYIGQTIPDNIAQYSTPAEAKAALNEYKGYEVEIPIYLKHTIVRGIVTEVYTVFEITDAVAATHPKLNAGTYYLQAGDTCVYDRTNNTYDCSAYDNNVAVLNTAFDASACHETPTSQPNSYNCSDVVYASTQKNGTLTVLTTVFGCGYYAYSNAPTEASCGQTLD